MQKQTAASPGLARSLPRSVAGRRARLLALAAAAALAAGLIAAAATGGHRAAAPPSASWRVSTASPAVFRRALIARLRAQRADFQWVACIRNGRDYEHVAVVRCNVEFGEPHVEAYCAVFRGGRLLTNQDDPAIPCAPDDAGFSAPIHTYS